jgi:predicted transcriptional regulator
LNERTLTWQPKIRKANAKLGGGKLARSETVTVRLDPKLRYLAELAALKQRRTVSSFIEWAIEDTLSRECIQESAYGNDRGTTVADVASKLWDVDDADRFAKLALNTQIC